MSAVAGLAPSQIRAIGMTLGALYVFHAVRGLFTHAQLHPEFISAQHLVSALVWVPGVCAFVAFLGNRVPLGRNFLTVGVLIYPVAVALWPLVAQPSVHARLDFWIHQVPGLAAVAALVTLPRWFASVSLFLNCLIVELVMWEIHVVDRWSDSLVRYMFAIAYSGFFFIIVDSMLLRIGRTNSILTRSAREQADAAIMQARDEEIGRLDRLTHDFVLSLLSSAADGVPTDKLRVHAESLRRQLSASFPDGDDVVPLVDVVERIARRAGRYDVAVQRAPGASLGEYAGPSAMPRLVAIEFEAAAEEAVRNTVRHGEGGRLVELTVGDGLTARVSDDGPGFDPKQLRERLGVSQSILHRMNSLPGGQATVDSAPGRGTIVTIHWNSV